MKTPIGSLADSVCDVIHNHISQIRFDTEIRSNSLEEFINLRLSM